MQPMNVPHVNTLWYTTTKKSVRCSGEAGARPSNFQILHKMGMILISSQFSNFIGKNES